MSSIPSQPAAPAAGGVHLLPPWGQMLLAIISVQFGAALATQLFDVAGPHGVVALRTLLGALLFALFWRAPLRGHSRRAYAWMAVFGVNIALMMMVFYFAIDRIPLGVAVAVSFLGPLTVAVIGSRRPLDLLWVVLAAVGILFLSPIASLDIDPTGMLLALGSAACWGGYILISKRVNQLVPGNSALIIGMSVAALVALPVGGAGALQVLLRPELLLLTLAVALLSSTLPFWLEFVAIRRLTPRLFSLLLSLEPVAAALIGWSFLDQILNAGQVVGIVLVTLAAAAATWTARG